MLKHLDQLNFESTITNNEVVLVDFFADWCGPCKALHPTLESIADEFEGKAVISKINVDSNPELSKQFNVKSIPALFYFKNGELVGQQKGLQSKSSISQNISQLLAN